MARARKNKQDQHLPPRVYRGKSKFEWHPKEGGAVSLCPLDAPISKVWLAFERASMNHDGRYTLRDMAKQYFESPRFLDRAPKTQAGYLESWRALDKVLGSMDVKKIRPEHIRGYMDIRGQKHKVSANRERAILNNIFGFAQEYGRVGANPVRGVRTFSESGRAHVYIDDAEYIAFLRESTPMMQVFMELAYLLGARGQDLRALKLQDLHEEGIYIAQQKTGKKQLKRWNARLREAVNLAKRIRTGRIDPLKEDPGYLIVNESGGSFSESALKSLWQRNKAKVHKNRVDAANGKSVPDIIWTFHDIKAKAISDYEGDKQTFSGHKSRAMMERYNRSPDVMDAVNKPGGLETNDFSGPS